MSPKRYQNINATVRRGIQKSLVEINKALMGINKEAAAEAASEIEAAWKDLAAKQLSGRGKHLGNYLEGIQPVVITNGKIVFKISGYKAVMVERGWAPPSQIGSSPEDGFGEYDGHPHDMRPFLLHGKEGWDGVAGKGPDYSGEGFAYKVLRMPFEGATEAGLTSATRDYLQGKVNAGSMSQGKADKLTRKFTSGLRSTQKRADRGEGPPDYPNQGELRKSSIKGIPKSKTILWSETMEKPLEIQHRNFLYKSLKVTAEGGKRYSYHNLRTISENPKQKDLWFAIGVEPVNIMSDERGNAGPLVDKAVEILLKRGIGKVIRRLNGKRYKA